MGTAIVYSSRYLEHDTGHFHPESPTRLQSIMERLEQERAKGKTFGTLVEPRLASREEVELVHSSEYVERVKRSCEKGLRHLDSDTSICPESYDVARLAVGGLLVACERILAREFSNAIALVRPPGHHAGASGRALTAPTAGFCIFNNVAVAAEKLRREHGIDRVLILDYDCHHGNGTQEIFYASSSVMYLSIHQDGRTLYPGTGSINEMGEGEGVGYTVNIPLPPGSSDDAYAKAMADIVEPIAEQFDPEWILASVGFDALHDDPITGMDLSAQGFRDLFNSTIRLASSLCQGRCVVTLEGGYGKILPDAALATLSAMAGVSYDPNDKTRKTLPTVMRSVELAVEEAKEALSPYWKME